MSWRRVLDGPSFHAPPPTRRRAPCVTDVGVAFFVIATAMAAFLVAASVGNPAVRTNTTITGQGETR